MAWQQDDIYAELRRRVIELDYRPGEVLSERDLVSEFHTSRTPVREALLMLEKDGLVEIVPRVGTYVTQIDLRSVKNAYEMKKNLEGLAAELAAQRATEEQVLDLLSIAQGFSQLDNVQQYRECIENDKKFHYFTRLASGNPLLIKTLNDLSVITVRFLQYIQYVEEDYQWYKGSVMAIARAIRDRDGPRARSEAEEHTAAFLAKLASYFFG
ncbi:MAG: GntR family transcriptional regulator [Synergistales bacterium]|nr:GntR family transcriptional regulator [Synergistales bacterium]